MPNRTCSIEGCERPHLATGLCSMHYARKRLTGTAGEAKPRKDTSFTNRRVKATCEVDTCTQPVRAKQLCNKHYLKLLKYGDPTEGTEAFGTPENAFLCCTKRDGECLVWTGHLEKSGYGVLGVQGKKMKAHRFAWERSRGKIPAGLFIDHICHNRRCVNVQHLRLVTTKQNAENLRGARIDNKTGVRGVSLANGSYVVRVKHLGKTRTVGRFKTLEEANQAAITARNEVYTHNTLDRLPLDTAMTRSNQ